MSLRTSDIVVNHANVKQVVDCLFPRSLYSKYGVRKGSTWKPRMIVAAALLWAVGGTSTLKDRFDVARRIVAKIFRWNRPPGETYQGFLDVLRNWHEKLKQVVIPHLRALMESSLPVQWLVAGFNVFAVDGSRVELSRTKSLEKAFSPKRKKEKQKKAKGKQGKCKDKKTRQAGSDAEAKQAEAEAKKRNSPQMWLTLLWHVGTGLPWAWRTGPSDSSERSHFQEMLKDELPNNSLITADAGFVGYHLWRGVLDAGHHFVIRVGANVSLIKHLGFARQHAHTVYLWPDAASKKKQPPLVLRLIVINNGRHPVYLVTDLPKSELNDNQAAQIFGARWGIELFFRTFKQTFGCRKLLSRASQNANLELDWSMLGLWCICLIGQRELVENDEDPTRQSPAATIKAFQKMIAEYRLRPESHDDLIWEQLRVALLDNYERKGPKTSRSYPVRKKHKAVGSPKIIEASKQQIDAANKLKSPQREIHLTA